MGAKYSVAAVASMVALSAPVSQAQQTAGGPQAADRSFALEEIVVTARRKEESSQDVPIAITAFSQEDVRQRNIETATELQNFVPSLNVLSIATGSESFTLRGLGATGGSTTGGGVGGGQGVVAYLAEAPSTASGPGLFFDLQSLQVLKGPQGTLFGRNTTGGAVLLEPVRPSDDVDGYVEVGAGNYNRREFRAAGNIPIVPEKLSVRIAAAVFDRAGYVEDVVTGRDYNDRENGSVRIGVLARPFEGFENYLLSQLVHTDSNGVGNILVAVNPATPLGITMAPFLAEQRARGNDRVSFSFSPVSQTDTLSVINSTRWQIVPALAVKNIFSYTHTRGDGSLDGDGTSQPFFDLKGANPGGYASDLETFTEELQFQGAWGDYLNWQGGGYYERVENPGPQTYNSEIGGLLFFNQALKDQKTRSRAGYAQATLDLGLFSASLRHLKLTAGYRHTWDDIYQAGYSTNSIPALGLVQCATGEGGAPGVYPDCFQDARSKSDGPSWTVGLDYHLNDETLVYLYASEGYKSGGFNDAVPENTPFFAYEPEKARNHELGIKSEFSWAGMPLRTDFNVFHTDYDQVQRSVYASVDRGGVALPTQLTNNAASATIRGIELQTTVVPLEPVQLSLTYSYLDAYYNRYVTPIGEDFTDKPFNFTPEHKISFDQRYRLPSAGRGDLSVRGTVSYQSEMAVADDPQPFDTIAAYTLLNLRLDWQNVIQSASAHWDVALFATNVTDRTYRINTNPTYLLGLVTTVYGEPRMWGVSVRCRFDR